MGESLYCRPNALKLNREELVRSGTALIFIVGIMLFTIVRTDAGTVGVLLVIAAMIGGYMAMNIGANDAATKGDMLREMKNQASENRLLAKRERRGLGRVHRVELVKRVLLLRIAAAWVITVPLAGTLAAMFFFMIRGIMLP